MPADDEVRAQLGLGLSSIGRVWGHDQALPPPESEVRALLETAFELGIRVFDTAPAYGTSERLLGQFLRTLSEDQRRTIFVATKFGEHWDERTATPFVDHSYDALMRSLDRSVELLRDIDLVQVHKASVAALEGEGLRWALEGVPEMDIPQIGASVSDIEAGRKAIEMGFHWIQMPYNSTNTGLEPLFAEAETGDVHIITNRPFATGALIAKADTAARSGAIDAALGHVLAANRHGVILTGTKSPAHLKETLARFEAVSDAPFRG
jgi:aryl-alcohol dehydrogenase-like predicted oxidoreductase